MDRHWKACWLCGTEHEAQDLYMDLCAACIAKHGHPVLDDTSSPDFRNKVHELEKEMRNIPKF